MNVHGAGGAPRQAQVLLAGRGAPAGSPFLPAEMGNHSCRQYVWLAGGRRRRHSRCFFLSSVQLRKDADIVFMQAAVHSAMHADVRVLVHACVEWRVEVHLLRICHL